MPRLSKNKLRLKNQLARGKKAARLKREQGLQIPTVKKEEVLGPDLSEESDIPLITVIKFEPEFTEENESRFENDENGLDSIIKSETEMSTYSESKHKKFYFTLEDITAAMNDAIDHSQVCKNAKLNLVKTMQDNLNTEYPVYCISCKITPFVINAGSPKQFGHFNSQSEVFISEGIESGIEESEIEKKGAVHSKIDSNWDGLVSRKSARRKQRISQLSSAKRIPNVKLKHKKRSYKRHKALKVPTKAVSEMNPSVVISRCDDLLIRNSQPLNENEITVPVRKYLKRPLKSRNSALRSKINFKNRARQKNHRKDQQERDNNEQAGLAEITQEEGKHFECICGKFYRTIEAIRHHEKSHTLIDPIICEKCGESFQRKSRLYRHYAVTHLEALPNAPTCKLCGKTFIWQQTLQRHVQKQHSTNPRPIICDKCGNCFSFMNDLRKHQLIHKDDILDKELFRCKQCGILLKHSVSLRKHMLIMHNEDQKLVSCPQCGKTTKNMTNMRIHMKVHDPNRNLKRKSLTNITK